MIPSSTPRTFYADMPLQADYPFVFSRPFNSVRRQSHDVTRNLRSASMSLVYWMIALHLNTTSFTASVRTF